MLLTMLSSKKHVSSPRPGPIVSRISIPDTLLPPSRSSPSLFTQACRIRERRLHREIALLRKRLREQGLSDSELIAEFAESQPNDADLLKGLDHGRDLRLICEEVRREERLRMVTADGPQPVRMMLTRNKVYFVEVKAAFSFDDILAIRPHTSFGGAAATVPAPSAAPQHPESRSSGPIHEHATGMSLCPTRKHTFFVTFLVLYIHMYFFFFCPFTLSEYNKAPLYLTPTHHCTALQYNRSRSPLELLRRRNVPRR